MKRVAAGKLTLKREDFVRITRRGILDIRKRRRRMNHKVGVPKQLERDLIKLAEEVDTFLIGAYGNGSRCLIGEYRFQIGCNHLEPDPTFDETQHMLGGHFDQLVREAIPNGDNYFQQVVTIVDP